MNRLWGVTCHAEGMRLEKLMNEAARKGLRLYDVKREQDRRMRVTCSPGTYRAFARLARDKGYTVTEPIPVGALGTLTRLKQRKGIMIGVIPALLLLFTATRFVWDVRVENAGAYIGEVRQFLEENDLRPGIRRSQLDVKALREKLEWRLPAVQWVTAEMDGMVLRIRLGQGTPPPEIQERGAPGDVVAAEDGILMRLTVFTGTAVCRNGDFVRKGQVLIKGEEMTSAGVVRQVKARGEAVARVFVRAQAQSSLMETRTIPTGKMARRQLLVTPLGAFSAQEEPPFLTWDEERSETPVGGVFFPILFRRETRLEAALENDRRSEEETRREAGEMALFSLNRLENSDDFVDKWVDYSMIEGGIVVATATAEIHRDIARYQKSP